MTSAADTKYELEQAEKALREARTAYKDAMKERNAVLARARKEGLRPSELAKVTGLTSARIAQLR